MAEILVRNKLLSEHLTRLSAERLIGAARLHWRGAFCIKYMNLIEQTGAFVWAVILTVIVPICLLLLITKNKSVERYAEKHDWVGSALAIPFIALIIAGIIAFGFLSRF